MGAVNFEKSIRYEVQRPNGTDYEIYSFRKDENGEWTYFECFITDMFGRVVEYDVWSDTLQEFVSVDLKAKTSAHYKQCFSEIKDYLKLAIVEHECQKGVAL